MVKFRFNLKNSAIASVYYLSIYPFVILYKSLYYITQYFLIKSMVSKRISFHLKRGSSYSRHSKAKLIVATTYTSLTAKLLSDVISKNKTNILKKEEFLAIIDFYFLILIADDFVDIEYSLLKLSPEEKISLVFDNVEEIIKNPKSYIEYTGSNDFLSEVSFFINEYYHLWSDEYGIELLYCIKLSRRACLLEVAASSSLKRSWQSLYRMSKVTVILYESINFFIYKDRINDLSLRKYLYNFAFSGNLIDDWMDYYWTKEDVGKPCFLLELSKHHKLKKTSGYFFNLVTFLSSAHMISNKIIKIRVINFNNIKYTWITPSFVFVLLFSSPISIWMHMKERFYDINS